MLFTGATCAKRLESCISCSRAGTISAFRNKKISVFPMFCCVQVLSGLSAVGSSHAEAVLSVLRSRREEIHRALLDRTNSISSATLQDFDWQLKVTEGKTSSSK